MAARTRVWPIFLAELANWAPLSAGCSFASVATESRPADFRACCFRPPECLLYIVAVQAQNKRPFRKLDAIMPTPTTLLLLLALLPWLRLQRRRQRQHSALVLAQRQNNNQSSANLNVVDHQFSTYCLLIVQSEAAAPEARSSQIEGQSSRVDRTGCEPKRRRRRHHQRRRQKRQQKQQQQQQAARARQRASPGSAHSHVIASLEPSRRLQPDSAALWAAGSCALSLRIKMGRIY